ncbi:helix-turn-helix domain-containing protein [Streptomyces sp. CRN 30]|uniref:TetR/AcrR family transcriptional regulator n=1 Tax=Streptomyces sp. CRN 30 TaxID=3075613 RepID=UPI002A815026|nr:helix-turn-helix domain-containing protein [Streptomyces sp. CRN 30]
MSTGAVAPGDAGDAEETTPDRRRLRSRRTRAALSAAAVDLILEAGLAATGVEAVADRAQVTRRTFSRHFTGKEDAALDFARADGERINEALRRRPRDEPLLSAYRAAVHIWLTDPCRPAEHSRPGPRALLALVPEEPDLFAAYARIRAAEQNTSVGILARRLGVDPAADPRPGIVVEAGAGVLGTVLYQWARDTSAGPEDLAGRVDRAFDALLEESFLARRPTAALPVATLPAPGSANQERRNR